MLEIGKAEQESDFGVVNITSGLVQHDMIRPQEQDRKSTL